jgi:hypothetical protein
VLDLSADSNLILNVFSANFPLISVIRNALLGGYLTVNTTAISSTVRTGQKIPLISAGSFSGNFSQIKISGSPACSTNQVYEFQSTLWLVFVIDSCSSSFSLEISILFFMNIVFLAHCYI